MSYQRFDVAVECIDTSMNLIIHRSESASQPAHYQQCQRRDDAIYYILPAGEVLTHDVLPHDSQKLFHNYFGFSCY